MKAHPPAMREFIILARRQRKSWRAIVALTLLPRSTVRSIAKHSPPSSEGETTRYSPPPQGAWMQSLHHDSAHFLINGEAACAGGQNGVHSLPGVAWFAHDGNLRKCFRCMKHAANYGIEKYHRPL